MNEDRYNLRSNRGECQIPIQLQLVSDADFLTASGEGPSSSHSGQVGFTDLSDSGSNIDIDALVDHSDQNLSPTPHGLEGVHKAGRGHTPQSMGSNQTDVDQNHINTEILAQLTALGARLDNMESLMKTGKKTGDSSKIKRSGVKPNGGVAQANLKGVGPTSPPVHTVTNIPPPRRLREEARIQEEVQNRLRHLADNVKPGMGRIKSQRGGAVDVFVSQKVRWPHEFVLSGQNKDRITYNQVSPVQWMAGFCRSIWEESDTKHMLDYVIDLLDDATDFSWASAKASHAVLLCRMEQREISSWLETEKIDRVRRAHAQRHSTGQGSTQRAQDKHSSAKTATCVYYNKGVCSHKQTHETKGVLYKHVCAFCWAKDGKAYPHPQTECCRSTKNE